MPKQCNALPQPVICCAGFVNVVFDFAIISNPTHLHFEYIEKLAKKGFDLFIEKPALHSLENATELLQLIEDKNIVTYVACNLRFHPCILFLKNKLDTETLPDGTIVKTIYGVERIPDPMLLKEMQAYRDGLNVDRIVAFCALVAFAKVQQANRGYKKRVEYKDTKHLQKSDNLFKLNKSPFRNMGKNSQGVRRSAFKNIK
jgi:hypothetical protein